MSLRLYYGPHYIIHLESTFHPRNTTYSAVFTKFISCSGKVDIFLVHFCIWTNLKFSRIPRLQSCEALCRRSISCSLMFSKNVLKAQLPEPQLPPQSAVACVPSSCGISIPQVTLFKDPQATFGISHREEHCDFFRLLISLSLAHRLEVFLIAIAQISQQIILLRSVWHQRASTQSSFLVSHCRVTSRPAWYAEGTFSVRQAGNGITSTFCTDTFSGVFNRSSQLIQIASGQKGPGFLEHTKPTAHCTLGGRCASKQAAFKVSLSLWSVVRFNFALSRCLHSNYNSVSNLAFDCNSLTGPQILVWEMTIGIWLLRRYWVETPQVSNQDSQWFIFEQQLVWFCTSTVLAASNVFY